RFEKVPTPDTALTVLVPERVPLPAFVPMAIVMLALELVTVLPRVSWTVTWTAGAIDAPAMALLGCPVTASLLAAPGVMLKVELVAPVREPEDAAKVYPFPVFSMERFEKVATPELAATVAVPERVPPLGLVPMATVTLAEELVTVFPKLSCTVT